MQGIEALWSSHAAPSTGQTTARAMATGSSTSQTSTANATISANDFLTLLVTEMKNQDPTANNDPNQYINQLVQVNSLEQLVDINQTVSSALGSTTTSSSSASSAAQGVSTLPSWNGRGTSPQTVALPAVGGNLSVPAGSSAASRIASALNGRL